MTQEVWDIADVDMHWMNEPLFVVLFLKITLH